MLRRTLTLALLLLSWSALADAAPLPRETQPAQPVLPDLTQVRDFQTQPVSWWPYVINAGWGGGRGGPERLEGWTADNWLLLDVLDRSGDFTSNDWLTHRGIWYEVYGHNEYQETIHFVLDGAKKLFWDNGFAQDYKGDRVLSPEYNNSQQWWKDRVGWDAYIVCNNAPRWSAVIDYDLLSAAALGHATSQDNIGGPTSRIGAGGHGRYCDFCNRRFFDYLTRTNRLPEFRSQYKSIRDYVQATQMETLKQLPPFGKWTFDPAQAQVIEKLCAPPVMNQYQKFLYLSHLSNWITYYNDCKLAASRQGRDFDVHGNQGGSAIGATPYQVALADFVDTVWFETQGVSAYDMFRYHWNNADGALRYVMGRAMTRGTKPFMSMLRFHKLTPDIVEHEIAECCAGGGVLFPYQDSLSKEPALQQIMTDYYRFRHQNRGLYQPQNSQPLSDVGLIYSIPSLMYHDYMYSVSKPLCAFEGVARACQEGHVQYDVVIMNHPEIHADHWGLEELKRYRVLIVPAVECMTDAQIALLTDYLKQGGTLAVTGDCGTRDEDNLPRETSPLEAWKKAGRVVEIRPGKTFLPPRASEGDASRAQTAETLQGLHEAIQSPILQGELPSLLWVKTWTHGAGEGGSSRTLSAHFVNYNVDFETGTATDTQPLPLTVTVPQGVDAQEATWLLPGKDPLPLEVQVADGRATVTIPSVHIYGILTIGSREAQQQRNHALQAQALLARAQMAVATRPADDPLRTRVDSAAQTPQTPQSARELLQSVAQQSDADYLAGLKSAVTVDKPLVALAFGAPQDFAGWKCVKADMDYTAERGFGWLPVTDDSEPLPDETYYDSADKYGKDFVGPEPKAQRLPFWPYKQPVPQPLQFSLSSGTSRSFRLDVPAGRYRVRIVNVNPSWTNYNFRVCGMVQCNGKVMLLDEALEKSSLVARGFEAASQDGHLDLTFGGATGWGVAALIVEPIAPEAPARVLPERTLLRDWQVSPRIPNPEWWRTVTTPLEERLKDLPLADWTKLQATCDKDYSPTAGLPVLDLGSNHEGETGDVVYAVTTLQGPAKPGATLRFGSTSQATLWLNGEPLGFVPNEKGLREEFVVSLSLKQGENKLVVKLQRFWERRWMFTASVAQDLTQPGGTQMTAKWECITKEAAFSTRDTAEDFVLDGKMWLSNGYHQGNVLSRDLWNSADGVTWTKVADETPYDGYSEMVVYQGKVWAIKGSVWNSTDGLNWTRVLEKTPFGVRGYGEIVVHDGKMWHLGSGDDVWNSTDGVNWTRTIESAPFGNRYGSAVAVYGGKLWLLGGKIPGRLDPPEKGYPDMTTFNDVWCSADGVKWERVLEHAPWSPRMWFIAREYAGKLWFIGGYDNKNAQNLGDVWFTEDGKTWQQFAPAPEFTPRHESTVYVFNGSLWVVAGNSWPLMNDVWRLTLPGADH